MLVGDQELDATEAPVEKPYEDFSSGHLRFLRADRDAKKLAGRPDQNRVSPAVLSTYFGHLHPANTYWYLSAAPELLGLAAARFESVYEHAPTDTPGIPY